MGAQILPQLNLCGHFHCKILNTTCDKKRKCIKAVIVHWATIKTILPRHDALMTKLNPDIAFLPRQSMAANSVDLFAQRVEYGLNIPRCLKITQVNSSCKIYHAKNWSLEKRARTLSLEASNNFNHTLVVLVSYCHWQTYCLGLNWERDLRSHLLAWITSRWLLAEPVSMY